ncbi:MAG: MBL fold metallo-hydrolase [Bacillota bacterium]|nr:MBL fold metallo-hydrolase [Bacillota bacterium]
MKLTVLVDNNTTIDKNYWGEPGLSFYIEDGQNKILFDVGYSDIFLRNAYKMGIDIKKVNHVVLSHGHLDHTWGMSHLIGILDYYSPDKKNKKATLLAHPQALSPKTDNGEHIGMMCSDTVLKDCFNVSLSKAPVWISNRLVFLGEIERINAFENKRPLGVTMENGVGVEDFIMDDSALVYKSDKGLVIITGCSHSGICNIVEYAKKICGEERIVDIIGGLHLLNPSEQQLKGTMEYMKRLKSETVHACHCTDLKSKIALSQVVNLVEVGVGLELEYK